MAGPTSQPGARGSRRRRVVREAHTGPRAKDLEDIIARLDPFLFSRAHAWLGPFKP